MSPPLRGRRTSRDGYPANKKTRMASPSGRVKKRRCEDADAREGVLNPFFFWPSASGGTKVSGFSCLRGEGRGSIRFWVVEMVQASLNFQARPAVEKIFRFDFFFFFLL
jgi:hypothetical protein